MLKAESIDRNRSKLKELKHTIY